MFDQYTDIFERRGLQYNEAMLRYPFARINEFKKILEMVDVQKNHQLLDMPAGGAYLRKFIEIEPVNYVALETTSSFIAHLPVDERPILTLAKDISCTQLAGSSFDRVVSLAGLHHIINRAPVYAEIKRLLRPGGVACIADVQAETPTADFLNGPVDTYCTLGHKGLFLNEQDEFWIEKAGLKILESQLINVPWQFESIREMGQFCTLLFGLDKALNVDSVTQSIINTVGIIETKKKIQMNWNLRFIKLFSV